MTELGPGGMPGCRGTALVTGGSRGIGRGVVFEAARRGWHVVLTYRSRADEAADVVRQAADQGWTVEALQADMADAEAVRALGADMAGRPALSLLVNNAGIGMEDSLRNTKLENWHEALAVNLTAPMLLSQALADRLAENRGAIVNMSSSGGVVGSVHGPAYGSTKAALIGLTMTLARELAPAVRVNAIAPGPVDTDLWAGVPEAQKTAVYAQTPLGRVCTVEEIGRVTLDVAEWTYVTGIVVVADGGRVMR
ncbi:MAG: short-chain dehydrogenase/reductase [Blastococcus sp.]|nr:short-chain dehydrogenase/reductase [Blastococcus sp.]